MGAANALRAYALYAGRVPPLSMQLLAYMALVSKDSDARPWYGQGHKQLALGALGRRPPLGRADIAAIERGISALLDIGAIYCDRRPTGNRKGPKVARYRLNLEPQLPLDIDQSQSEGP